MEQIQAVSTETRRNTEAKKHELLKHSQCPINPKIYLNANKIINHFKLNHEQVISTQLEEGETTVSQARVTQMVIMSTKEKRRAKANRNTVMKQGYTRHRSKKFEVIRKHQLTKEISSTLSAVTVHGAGTGMGGTKLEPP